MPSCARAVRRGIERGEPPADTDVESFVDLVLVPFIYWLPIGDYPHSRPPQGILPEAAKEQLRWAYERSSLVKLPTGATL